MEYAPPPRDPESEARGHELRDVAMRPIIIFLVGLVLFGGVLQGVMSLIMTGYVRQDTKLGVISIDKLSDPGADAPLGPWPPLQNDTTRDMLRMYGEEDAILKANAPTRDERTGKVLVPIDEAIAIVAKKGLPHRDTPPKIDRDYHYSEKARAYRAAE